MRFTVYGIRFFKIIRRQPELCSSLIPECLQNTLQLLYSALLLCRNSTQTSTRSSIFKQVTEMLLLTTVSISTQVQAFKLVTSTARSQTFGLHPLSSKNSLSIIQVKASQSMITAHPWVQWHCNTLASTNLWPKRLETTAKELSRVDSIVSSLSERWSQDIKCKEKEMLPK